jgi:hypothetical protein
VFPFITPPVWRSHISIALDGLATTAPQGLILCSFSLVRTSATAHALDLCALVVVWYEATPVCVLYFVKVFVTSQTMESRWWCEVLEERRESGEGMW